MKCFASFDFAAKILFFFLQDVDEKLLHDTFSAFGVIVTNPKVIICYVCFFSFAIHES
jgi:hypothetical protein